MTTPRAQADGLLERLRHAAEGRSFTFMEVCGTHTMSVFRSGLHSLLPSNVTLLSGPGCPVCVTSQGDIDMLIALAQRPEVTLCTYGDMLRVPGASGSLEQARGAGSDVRVVYSTLDALRLAQELPGRQVVFTAVGFETTAPATAAAIPQARRLNLANLSFLISHKRVLPALHALLEGRRVKLDGILLPGHVSVILGSQAYRPVVARHHMPCVIAGFEDINILESLVTLAEMARDGRAELLNGYPQAVTAGGNRVALTLIDEVFEPGDARWRGLGLIPASALVLRPAFRQWDAQKRFALTTPQDREPAGCLCGKVITGLARPHDCTLFGASCTPIHPIGPCMVSSEGTCQAWFKYHRQRGLRTGALTASGGKP
jgi:hydrogenase expression/formation protein HypD